MGAAQYTVMAWSLLRVSQLLRLVLLLLTVTTICLCCYALLQLTLKKCPPQTHGPHQGPQSYMDEENDGLRVLSRGYSAQGCQCVRFGHDIASLYKAREQALVEPWTQPDWFLGRYSRNFTSTCSDYATQRGAGQKVVSYSYYGRGGITQQDSENYRKYLAQLYSRARSVAELYPGWLVRVYHNASEDDTVTNSLLCKMYCHMNHVDLCHVSQLPTLGNLGKRQPVGRTWRFAVMGDPTVSSFLSRDADSYILDREVAAVQEWLQSGRGFHLMRDHPHHKAAVLAGLWGAHNKYPVDMARIRDDMFSAPLNLSEKYDQHLLATKLWPFMEGDVLQHASYNCLDHPGSLPFSTHRSEWKYCGWGPYKAKERNTVFLNKCPKECRPRDHPQWVWC